MALNLLTKTYQFVREKMSYNKTPINGIKIKCDGLSQPWSKQSVHLEANIKLAGEEAKDRLYEPKHKKKLVRVLTVIAYVFFVSLAAIMLSLYYILLWNGDQKVTNKYQMYESKIQIQQPRCNDIVAGIANVLKLLYSHKIII